jgi:predicted nucleotidyltransferase
MAVKPKRKREVKTEEWLKAVIARLQTALADYGAEEAYLVGSFARGEWDDYSDIDLIVVKETKQNFLERMLEFTKKYHPGCAFDVLIYNSEEFAKMASISGFFRHAMKDAVKIYEKGQSGRS